MVDVFKYCVCKRVLLPRIIHAIREPITALPMPIQVDAIPNFHPN
jgi:hypothetical protein